MLSKEVFLYRRTSTPIIDHVIYLQSNSEVTNIAINIATSSEATKLELARRPASKGVVPGSKNPAIIRGLNTVARPL